ncbi:sensor histidine kinase [Herbiconiux sp. A18JL235]|uniref:Sensor histidine kinase n=1 Tax=Herbiconiux sp. A18JL235 TaxID=3152363 RepID=A0AB39BK60_9MICO
MTAQHDPLADAAGIAADRRAMLTTVGVTSGLFGVTVSIQSVLVLGAFSSTLRAQDASPLADVTVRVLINLLSVGVVVLLTSVLQVEQHRGPALALRGLAAVVGGAGLRGALQLAAGVYPIDPPNAVLTDALIGSVLFAVTLVAGLVIVGLLRRLRDEERQRFAQELTAREALESLQREELRVRREVAENIHGSVQNRFVLLAAELAAVADGLDECDGPHGPPDAPRTRGDRIRAVANELDRLRESELRALSEMLYPIDLDRGLPTALRSLFARIPPSIRTELTIDPRADAAAARLPEPAAILVLRVVEDGVSNALRHGKASALALSMDVDGDTIVLALRDDGVGLPPDPRWSGLARLRRQLESVGGALALRGGNDDGGPGPGAVLEARLPLPT